ncbi:conserved membrane hypothetical protein [Cupriavidus taiwanensis]|nr:conserved membrane hypothetical protein [Cupriavidus taiwanensis]SOY73929.1 conserved membrane hypothetical protein [Cupriavidus taiwanensis]SOY97913.1 conserved membrane hypothetical protein [Cupriavidus taiwanensis]SOZ67743.1 conserved membrane hypothetical protein [Cupriavidus taiwanensis]SOZ84832.1 conserved membrane hypothetical protein [Cupriavidus taiwanensis]
MSKTTSSGPANMATVSQAQQKPSAGASALRANADAAKKCAPGNKSGKCGFCDREGYPILPVRYAVVPSYLQNTGTLPLSAVTTLDSFEKKRLRLSKYVLRTLRKGFVHVYLGTPGVWQSYVVTTDGYLRLLADPDDPDWKVDRPMTTACKRDGHNIPASFITIPPGYEKVWLAFAEDVWSSSVRATYEKAPDKRMQSCQVSALASTPGKAKHAFEIGQGQSGLNDLVFEYVDEEPQYTSRCSYEGGYWNDKGRQQKQKGRHWQSLHGNFPRAGQGPALAKFAASAMERRSKSGKPGKVAAFALYDAVGIVKELNGQTHDRIQWRQAYCGAVARPLLISQAIVGLKKQIAVATSQAIETDEKARGVGDRVTTSYVVGNPNYTPDAVQTVTTTRKERIESKSKEGWNRLQERYNEAERVKFEEQYVQQMTTLTNGIGDADADWEVWARSNEWKVWLGDYDLERLHENVRLMVMCAPCLAGGPQGKAGVKLWEDWLTNEKDATNPAGYTIPYAAIMGGRKDLLKYLFPSGAKPWKEDELNKGDKLYDTVKGILGSDELKAPEKFKNFMDDKVQQAAAHLLGAIEGAASQMSDKTTDAIDVCVRRATQAALKLYRNATPIFLQVRMTVGQYVDMLNQLSRKGSDAAKKLTDVAGRKARSVLLGGILTIPNDKVRNTVIEVTLWSFEEAEQLKTTIEASVAKARQQMVEIGAGTASALKIAGVTLSREAVQILRPLEHSVRLLPGAAKLVARDVVAKSLKIVAGSGEPLLALGSLLLQCWSFRDSKKTMDAAVGPQGGIEAKLPVASATLGILGAMSELGGLGLKAMGSVRAESFMKAGAFLGAISLSLDAIQAGCTGFRAWEQGDKSAARAYGVAAVAFGAGAVVGFASGFSTALVGGLLGIGPLGWVLLLTAAGVMLYWWATSLESTPVEIWLDRCYWGYGKRAEGKWIDGQLNEELADLNALVLGLGVELGFNDDWFETTSGFDTLRVKLSFANFDGMRSVYEWKVKAIDGRGQSQLVMAGGRDAQVMPELRAASSTATDTSLKFRNRQGTGRTENGAYVVEESVEVNTRVYKRAQIDVRYWPDRNDTDGWAEKLITVSD